MRIQDGIRGADWPLTSLHNSFLDAALSRVPCRTDNGSCCFSEYAHDIHLPKLLLQIENAFGFALGFDVGGQAPGDWRFDEITRPSWCKSCVIGV